MMLLITMAITVAYVASMATSVGVFDLDFWWELAALITIMLLGHWLEMRHWARRAARSPRWPSCCPTRRSGRRDGSVTTVPLAICAWVT
jgi:Cu2+-exporting ATPase